MRIFFFGRQGFSSKTCWSFLSTGVADSCFRRRYGRVFDGRLAKRKNERFPFLGNEFGGDMSPNSTVTLCSWDRTRKPDCGNNNAENRIFQKKFGLVFANLAFARPNLQFATVGIFATPTSNLQLWSLLSKILFSAKVVKIFWCSEFLHLLRRRKNLKGSLFRLFLTTIYLQKFPLYSEIFASLSLLRRYSF